jgi:NAD(P)H-quinone oxidoreductase subunit 5
LLVFYPERPGALLAAKKKFITARLGDACLIGAVILMVKAFGTFDIANLLEQARLALGAGIAPVTVPYAAGLLALAALLKSAQFPTHGWLLEVMETPTPVSALLHAGIINAGGFLIVRFAEVMVLSAPSLYFLAVVGGFTALLGAIAMLTQTSVKVSLAWSTIAQMGFMLLQCGLGAFSIAVLHIVAHSLYKAHAFLSSGSVVELARSSRIPAAQTSPSVPAIVGNLGLALAIVVLIGTLLGVSPSHDPAVLAFGAIFVLGLSQLIFTASLLGKGIAKGKWLIARTIGIAAVLSGVYFVLQKAAALLLSSALPAPSPPDGAMVIIMLLAVTSFAAATVLQLAGPRGASAVWERAYVHLSNGLYANTLFNRFAGALKRPAGPNSFKEIA